MGISWGINSDTCGYKLNIAKVESYVKSNEVLVACENWMSTKLMCFLNQKLKTFFEIKRWWTKETRI